MGYQELQNGRAVNPVNFFRLLSRELGSLCGVERQMNFNISRRAAFAKADSGFWVKEATYDNTSDFVL